MVAVPAVSLLTVKWPAALMVNSVVVLFLTVNIVEVASVLEANMLMLPSLAISSLSWPPDCSCNKLPVPFWFISMETSEEEAALIIVKVEVAVVSWPSSPPKTKVLLITW